MKLWIAQIVLPRSSWLKKKCNDANHHSRQPNQKHGVRAAQTSSREPVRKMIRIANPKWFVVERADNDNLRQINQRNCQNEQWREHGERMRILFCVKMRKNAHDREQIADEMTAGIAEERFRIWKIPR